MKIQVISDIHFEMFQTNEDFENFYHLITGGVKKLETILCIAGDLGIFHRQETWIEPLNALASLYRAVVCIAGNHEYYNNNVLAQESILTGMFMLPKNVDYLFNDTVIIDNIRFIGGTLWTSFLGRDSVAMGHAINRMNDFRLIRNIDGSTLTPAQTVNYHEICKSYIFDQIRIAKSRSEKVIVITHHCISPQSVHPLYRGDPLNAAFFTDLSEEIIHDGPDLWLHGHTHHSFDYTLGSTRVLCNPFGYLGHEENLDFKYQLEIGL